MKKLPYKGFTLVELLVVMSILGILVTLVAGGFRTAQMKGKDAQRKSDLKNLASALELFFADYQVYPGDSAGAISACPYDPGSGTGTGCVWGDGEFTDNRTVYFKVMPDDPEDSFDYFYRVVPGANSQKYQIFARLENTRDPDCLEGECENSPVTYSCGAEICNFAVTSSNTDYSE